MYKYVLTRKIKVFDTWTLFHAFYCSASSGWIKVLSFDACIESVASFCHLQNPLRTSPRSIRCAWNSRIWHFHLNNTLLPWSHVCFWRVKTKKTTVKSGHPWHRSSIRVKLFYLCQFRRFLARTSRPWLRPEYIYCRPELPLRSARRFDGKRIAEGGGDSTRYTSCLVQNSPKIVARLFSPNEIPICGYGLIHGCSSVKFFRLDSLQNMYHLFVLHHAPPWRKHKTNPDLDDGESVNDWAREQLSFTAQASKRSERRCIRTTWCIVMHSILLLCVPPRGSTQSRESLKMWFPAARGWIEFAQYSILSDSRQCVAFCA